MRDKNYFENHTGNLVTSPKEEDLANTMIRGSVWMLSMRGLVRILGISCTAILARLLVPEDFGLMAMVMVIVGMASACLDFGVAIALIRKQDAQKEHFDTGWTMRILESALIAVILLCATPWISSFYNEERLNFIAPIIALSIFIGGWENIGTIIIRKNLEFKKDFTFNLLKKLLSVIFVVSLAVYFRNYYAFAIGILLNNIAAVILSFIISDYRPSLTLKAVKDIWSVSQWSLLRGIAIYFYTQGDKLIVGKMSTSQNLGFYIVGKEIAELASDAIILPIGRALIPGFSTIQHDASRLRTGFLKTFSAMLIIALPIGFGIYIISDEAIPLLLGDNWRPTIPLLKILALYSVTTIISALASDIIVVVGKIKVSTFFSWLEMIVFFLLIYPAYLWNGVLGIAYARVATGCFSIIFNLGALSYLIKTTLKDYFLAMYRPFLAVLFMMIGIKVTNIYMIDHIAFEPGLLTLILKIIVGAVIYSFTTIILWIMTGKEDGIEKIMFQIIHSKIRHNKIP